MGSIDISFKNCRNITSVIDGSLHIAENTLNIFYAANGTGKTTIVRICDYLSKRGTDEEGAAYEALRSFASLFHPNDEDAKPSVTKPDQSLSVAIFDENWVDKHCFKQDSLRDDVFRIFVETGEYKRLASKRAQILAEIQQVLHQEEIDLLIKGFQSLRKGIGATSASGSLMQSACYSKAFKQGSPLGSVPKSIQPVLVPLLPVERADWLGWHTKGLRFTKNDQHRCPYCGTVDDALMHACIAYDESRTDAPANGWLKTATAFADNASLFNNNSLYVANAVLSAESNPTADNDEYFAIISRRANEVADTLSSLKSLHLNGTIDTPSIKAQIQDALTKLACKHHVFSEKIETTLSTITDILHKALDNIEKAATMIAEQNSLIESAVKNHEGEINTFLKEAGYNYEVELEADEKGAASLILKDADSAYPVLGSKDHLSYGERNAITLILFLYEVLEAKPDLIVLDDPVSSFDGDKRFALLYTLFSPYQQLLCNNLQDTTVALFTHDFLVVSDWLKVLKNTHGGSGIKANYLRTNETGSILCRQIKCNDIEDFRSITYKKAQHSANDLSRLIYARQLVELEKSVDESLKPAWNVLSSLFHKRENATDNKGNILDDNDMGSACNYIHDLTSIQFAYQEWYERVKNGSSYIVSCYEQSESAYEKLQFLRIILEESDLLSTCDKTIMTRFADETYHIGGDYLYQLDPCAFQQVPNYVESWCDDIVAKYKTKHQLD
ncbi:AAA family ATPase [Eggerthella sinensis]|jgi:ABC-type lipoprotein export system ATPase subunit|uniref:Protein CR006 P-loop domain-containing protein n=2 Tax=Eggerthellaceae TaxID=1643826 RepID=A0A3N0J0D3_9ACTN|nr:AAA family ATPase [Eggerthella sinensis]RDB70421.1 hypothetical protein C1876_04115 [Eggerthella sinensis]RNM42709.1 hypothetical protein DMP09_03675 [Eggerthella sinensis]